SDTSTAARPAIARSVAGWTRNLIDCGAFLLSRDAGKQAQRTLSAQRPSIVFHTNESRQSLRASARRASVARLKPSRYVEHAENVDGNKSLRSLRAPGLLFLPALRDDDDRRAPEGHLLRGRVEHGHLAVVRARRQPLQRQTEPQRHRLCLRIEAFSDCERLRLERL